jgi:signal transduction histidine kinase
LKKIYLLFYFLLIFSCEKKNDINSKKKSLNSSFTTFTKSQKKTYLDSLFNLLNDLNIDSIKTQKLFNIAAEYYKIKENKASFIVSNTIYQNALKNKDSFSMGRALYYMGDCYESFQKDSAYYYYKESEKIFQLIKNDDRLAKVHYNKAYLLFYEGNYVESEIEVIKALNYLKKGDNIELIYMCNSLQGSNHTELEEYDKALDYFNQAAVVLIKMQRLQSNNTEILDYKVMNTIDICNIFDKKGEYNKSVSQLKGLLSNDLKTRNTKLYTSILGNLAYSLMKSGKYIEAKDYYNRAFQLSKGNENSQSYLYKIINLGEFHLLTKDTAQANTLFSKALLLSKQLKSGNEELKTLNFLAVTNPKQATFYKNEYVKISDSIMKKQRASRDKFARIEFETSQVEDANKVLSYKNIVLLLGIIISIIVFLLVIYIRHKISLKKELVLLAQKNIADQELFKLTNDFQIELVNTKQNEQNRISKELHDGIMNQLYGVRLNLGFLNEYDDSESKEKRLFLVKELQKIEGEIRTLSHDLSSDNNFNNSDFTFLLHNLIHTNNDISEAHFSISIDEAIDWDSFSSLIKINVFRILQELFLNVNKYAKAKNCTLTMNVQNSVLHVTVKDDGIGFIISKTSDGIGLKNIKERLELLNGSITIESESNNGAQFKILIPNI